MLATVKYIHLLTLVTWLGSVIFFSFLAAPAIFKNFDRNVAGDIVGTIFPKYFLLEEISALLALATLAYIGSKVGFVGGVKIGMALLVVMTAIVFYAGMINAPKARAIKYEIRETTDETKISQMRKSFGKLHGISMALNMANLLLGLILLFFALGYLSLPPEMGLTLKV